MSDQDWVLVPREPSEEMLRASRANGHFDWRLDAKHKWQAMIAAAPPTPSTEALCVEIERLRAALKWVGEVHPVTGRAIDGYPAKVTMTWRQFNAMRVAMGLKPLPTKHDRALLPNGGSDEG